MDGPDEENRCDTSSQDIAQSSVQANNPLRHTLEGPGSSLQSGVRSSCTGPEGDSQPPDARPAALICVSSALVAQDIAATLTQVGLNVAHQTTTEAQALDWLGAPDEARGLHLAVVQSSPDRFQSSPLHAALTAQGAQVMLLVDRVEHALGADFTALCTPFFTEDLTAALARLLPGRKPDDTLL
ncbi:MAG: hypothetical protein ACXIU7_05525 [Roseinatronobacter sp.]